MSDGFILLGRFGAPHGVRGEIRIKSFTADPMAIAAYGEVSDRVGAMRFRLTNARHLKDDMLVARVTGVATREAAQALTNVEIYIERAKLPAAAEDEFYLNDLIGLEARLANGERFGRVVNVANFGAGDIIEIDTGSAETKLIPFTREAVPVVDVNAGFLVVDPPAEIDAPPPVDES